MVQNTVRPMRTTSLYAVSSKTVFLSTPATATRRSLAWEDWSSITLQLLVEFVTKTEVPGRPGSILQPVTLRG